MKRLKEPRVQTTSSSDHGSKVNYRTTSIPNSFYFLIFTCSVLIFGNTFTAEFSYDDSQAVVNNPDVIGTNSLLQVWKNDFWGGPLEHPGSHKSYRPLTTLSFRLNHFFFGLQPTSYHVVNVILHGICSCLVLRLAGKLLLKKELSVLATLIFSLHPIHCDAVASVVGRADVLMTIIVISGILLYEKNRNLYMVVLFSGLAMLCKETGIMLTPIVIVFVLVNKNNNQKKNVSKDLATIGTLAAGFIGVLTMRMTLVSFETPKFSPSDNPAASDSSLFVRTFTFLFLPIAHLQLLLWPNKLCFDWSMDSIPLIRELTDHRLIISVACYFTMFVILLKSTQRVLPQAFNIGTSHADHTQLQISRQLLFCLSFLILSFLPASNLFAHVGFVLAERILYLVSVPFSILIVIGIQLIKDRINISNNSLWIFYLLLLSFLSARTWTRNFDWKNEETLYRSAVHINPPKAYANLGHVFASKGRSAEAEQAYKLALKHRWNMADTWYNLGILYNNQGKKNETELCYRTAIDMRPHFAAAHLNLGLLLTQAGNTAEAMKVYQKCANTNVAKIKNLRSHILSQASCLFNHGRLLLAIEDLHTAENKFRKAESFGVTSLLPSILNSLGEVLFRSGKLQEADKFYQKALTFSPDHLPAHLTMAYLRIRQNRSSEAWSWLHKALEKKPDSPLVHFHIGLAHHKQGSMKAAKASLLQAISLDEKHLDSLLALSVVLRETMKNKEAEQILRRAVRIEESFATLSNLGAILHLNGHLEEAELYYLKALKLQPENEITIENLAKVKRQLAKNRRQ